MLRLTLLIPLLTLCAAPALAQNKTKKVDFAKQIWPILEKRCVDCHQAPYVDKNGRKRKPKGRVELDSIVGHPEAASAARSCAPARADKSLLYEVITLPADDEEIMPPAKKKGKPLSEEGDRPHQEVDRRGRELRQVEGRRRRRGREDRRRPRRRRPRRTAPAAKTSGKSSGSEQARVRSSSRDKTEGRLTARLTLSKRLKPVDRRRLLAELRGRARSG